MECDLFRLLVQKYHDGELAPGERAEYENHRRQCEGCRALETRYAVLLAALDGAPRFEPSPGFDEGVLSRVDVARYRVSGRRRLVGAVERLWNTAPVTLRNGAAIALVCALLLAIYRPLFDYAATAVVQGIAALSSAVLLIRDFFVTVETLWKGLGPVRNYEIVGQTLLRTLRHAAAGFTPAEIAAAVAVLVIVGAVLYRVLGTSPRKGETNVCML